MSRKQKMGDRIEALEEQMGEVKTTLQSLIEQMQTQSLVIGEMSKQLGKQKTAPENDTSVEVSSYNASRLAWKKVKLSVFEGDDPVAWITRGDIYFDVQNTPDEMRVKLSHLKDDLSWEKLKKALIVRYGGRRLENPFEELSTLRQIGSVEEFVEAFKLLSSQDADVEGELREKDDDGERYYGKKKVVFDFGGRKDWAGCSPKYRNGSNFNSKDLTRLTNMGRSNTTQKTGLGGSDRNRL
ncbi:hypothetical protein KIW84_056868 [Lathyrus oleraceus]|uniref:Retrotransposon gag domain-containing protein n=1 Tax=Pisum sativum TaxID=3888 RepID=A0A9D4X1R1_PEA|nr:hypothetical protein KIW84_056868 [Pisum sativum]